MKLRRKAEGRWTPELGAVGWRASNQAPALSSGSRRRLSLRLEGDPAMHESFRQTRRQFLQDTATLAAGVSLAWPLVSTAVARQVAADEKLAIGIIGAGGRGWDNLQGVKAERIVALADVDDKQAKNAFKRFPDAVRYRDFREMLDKEKSLDAVVVSAPDHVHATAAIAAMNRGLHVYCEKPLAHTIYEARRMSEVAQKTGVVTQMGIQGHAMEGTRRAVEVVRSGAIGDVKELHVWTDRPAGWWPQGEERPKDSPEVPETLDWDLWLGPAPVRPYNPVYVPFKWRGRWDFGTGAIGDMGVHDLDTAFWALELGLPVSAEVVVAGPKTDDCPPLASILDIRYPARGSAPPVKLMFYDGKQLPPAGAISGRKDFRQRLADDRHQGNALHADMARRRERHGHVPAAAAKGIRRLQAARADAAAGRGTSQRVDQRLQGRTADAGEFSVCRAVDRRIAGWAAGHPNRQED